MKSYAPRMATVKAIKFEGNKTENGSVSIMDVIVSHANQGRGKPRMWHNGTDIFLLPADTFKEIRVVVGMWVVFRCDDVIEVMSDEAFRNRYNLVLSLVDSPNSPADSPNPLAAAVWKQQWRMEKIHPECRPGEEFLMNVRIDEASRMQHWAINSGYKIRLGERAYPLTGTEAIPDMRPLFVEKLNSPSTPVPPAS